MVALFFGSRGWSDREAIIADLQTLDPLTTIIVHGGATGADQIAGEEAVNLGFHVAVVRAQWKRRGNSAGPQRNAAMMLLVPDVAFGYTLGTPGSRDMAERLEVAGVRVQLCRSDVTQVRSITRTSSTPHGECASCRRDAVAWLLDHGRWLPVCEPCAIGAVAAGRDVAIPDDLMVPAELRAS